MGKLFVIDGTDGSGKQTQFNKLKERFDKEGIEYKVASFPNYDHISSSLVKMYLSGEFGENAKDVSPYIASTFYAADRYATYKTSFEKFYPKKLSGGLLRRLNIACGIAHKPKLIFLDEPTVAVDPQSRNKILEGIVKLNKDGATIIYTSHYMEEVEQICTRIAIMDKGKNLAIGTNEELKKMIKNNESISIEILNLDKTAHEDLKQLPHVYKTTYDDKILKLYYSGGKHNLIRVLDYLKDKNIPFGRVYSELPTLNDVFLEITGKELRD